MDWVWFELFDWVHLVWKSYWHKVQCSIWFNCWTQSNLHVIHGWNSTGFDWVDSRMLDCIVYRNSSGTRGGSRKFRKRGPSLFPPPHLERKLQFSGHAAYSIVGVFVMQSNITLTFWKNKLIVLVEEKRGSRGPLGPSPKSAYGYLDKTQFCMFLSMNLVLDSLTPTCVLITYSWHIIQ